MKKIVMTMLALSLMQVGSVVAATEFKIGFVNTERVFREAAPAQKAQKKLEKEFAVRDQELQKMADPVDGGPGVWRGASKRREADWEE